MGQFAVALDKRQPYETDLRVPFFVRGPNIPQGVTVGSDGKGALISIDLAPTFLQLAGMDVEEVGGELLLLVSGGADNGSDAVVLWRFWL